MIGSRRFRRTAGAVATLAALTVLTGCGHTPGSAFRVGDTVVTRDTVDTLTNGLCRLNASNQQAQKAPRAKMVWNVVNALFQTAVASAYADHLGVGYDASTLRQSLTGIDSDASKLPADESKVYVDAVTQIQKGKLQAEAVGLAALKQQGTASPTEEQALTTGLALALKWAKSADKISIDPRYNVGTSYVAGAGDGSMSRAVSTFAKQAAAGSTTPSYADALPTPQRCG